MAHAQLPASPAQLVDSYVYDITLRRRDIVVGDSGKFPALNVRVREVSSPGKDLVAVILEAQAEGVYNDDKAVAELTLSIAAVFRILDPESVDIGVFPFREAILMAYPYLRSSVGQVWRLSALQFPPLPTLDTLGSIDVIQQAIDQRPSAQPPQEAKKRRAKKAR